MVDGPDSFRDHSPETDPEEEIVVGPTDDGDLGIGDSSGPSVLIHLEQVPSFLKKVTETYGIMLLMQYDLLNEVRRWTTEAN